MERDERLVLMGQDIAEYGGAFKITDGFVDRFGKERVRNTPLCESAILGAALGLSIKGMKSMMEMQFADFVSEGITQICNNFAKIHYRWGQNADVVVRMPTGAGVGAACSAAGRQARSAEDCLSGKCVVPLEPRARSGAANAVPLGPRERKCARQDSNLKPPDP